ncbi:MAG: low molecular weight phosphotyrosine protein phosphatase [Gammaproteobacteria bacterium]|nr:low molecular weight phosphotyrosine protein phosphatase [Gammaproteobacteria bacterium]
MRRILFVCLGNICRSPSAEGVFRALVARHGLLDQFLIDSAGTAAWHVGKAPDARSIAAARERGIDIGMLRARQVTPDDFHDFDLLLAMDSENLANLMALAPAGLEHKAQLLMRWGQGVQTSVPDPYYGGKEGFETVLDLLFEACEPLLAECLERRDGAH